jgi:hypothetical protein
MLQVGNIARTVLTSSSSNRYNEEKRQNQNIRSMNSLTKQIYCSTFVLPGEDTQVFFLTKNREDWESEKQQIENKINQSKNQIKIKPTIGEKITWPPFN